VGLFCPAWEESRGRWERGAGECRCPCHVPVSLRDPGTPQHPTDPFKRQRRRQGLRLPGG